MASSCRSPSALVVWSKDLKELKKWGSKIVLSAKLLAEVTCLTSPRCWVGRTQLFWATFSHSAPQPKISSLDFLLPQSSLNMIGNMGKPKIKKLKKKKTNYKKQKTLAKAKRGSGRVSSLHFVQRKAEVSPSSLVFTLILAIRTALPGSDLG